MIIFHPVTSAYFGASELLRLERSIVYIIWQAVAKSASHLLVYDVFMSNSVAAINIKQSIVKQNARPAARPWCSLSLFSLFRQKLRRHASTKMLNYYAKESSSLARWCIFCALSSRRSIVPFRCVYALGLQRVRTYACIYEEKASGDRPSKGRLSRRGEYIFGRNFAVPKHGYIV